MIENRVLITLVYTMMSETLGVYVWRVKPQAPITAHGIEMTCCQYPSASVLVIGYHTSSVPPAYRGIDRILHLYD